MKKVIRMMMLLALTALISGTASAQDQKKQRMTREQLAEVQAKHIAQELAFDDATSKKFVDAYTKCQSEIWALGPRNPQQKRQGDTSKSDEQTGKDLKDRFAHSQKILNIRQKYYAEYSKFLTQRQIERIYQIEKQMMNRLGNHGKDRPRRNPRQQR